MANEFSRLNFKGVAASTTDSKGQLTSFDITRDSSATYIDSNGVLQTLDGDSASSQASLEDETGYTYGQGVGSFVDDQAWFSGESLGTAVIDDDAADDDTGDWGVVNCTLTFDTDHYVITETNVTQFITRNNELSLTEGDLYKVSFKIKQGTCGADTFYLYLSDSGSVNDVLSFSDTIPSEWQSFVAYGTATSGTDSFAIRTDIGAGETAFIKDILIEPATSLSTDSTLNGKLLRLGDDPYAYGFIGEAQTGLETNPTLFDQDGGAGGTGDKGSMVEADLLLAAILDDDCSSDNFTKGTGWSYDATNDEYDCDGSQTGNTELYQNVGLESGKFYKATFTVKNYSAGSVKLLDGSGKGSLGWQSANGTYYSYIYSAGNVNIDVVANSDFVGSVDDIKVEPIDISWTPYGTNTMEIDSDALKISYVDNSVGAALQINTATDFSATPTGTKQYKLTGQSKVSAGNVRVRTVDTGGTMNFVTILSTSYIPFEIYFTFRESATTFICVDQMGAGESIWLKNLVLTEVTSADAQAVTVYKNRGLTTEGWTSIDSGFDYNDTSMTFDVFNTGGQKVGNNLNLLFNPNLVRKKNVFNNRFRR